MNAPGLGSECAGFSQVSNEQLLNATRVLVGRTNVVLAALLSHLAELEARGAHRLRACSSLYAYCIYELRFSEDEAFRRVTAARWIRQFPQLLDAVASGELHLTGLLLLAPHLTANNLTEVLPRAKHRTKKELMRLVRELDPLPAVPALIEPLGPAPMQGPPVNPGSERVMQAMNPVRDLAPGDRPRDWIETNGEASAPARNAGSQAADAPSFGSEATQLASALGTAALPQISEACSDSSPAHAPGSAPPERYKVQFTTNEEYVRLVERASELLATSSPKPGLEELHLRAMRDFVAALETRRFAAPSHRAQRNTRTKIEPQATAMTPAPSSAPSESARPAAAEQLPSTPSARSHDLPAEGNGIALQSRNTGDVVAVSNGRPSGDAGGGVRVQRSRYIPAAVRRAVFTRDGGCCTFVDARGQRCRERHGLELHHLLPFAQGGAHLEHNVVLRCKAHNTLAAERDFGRKWMRERADRVTHLSFAQQDNEWRRGCP